MKETLIRILESMPEWIFKVIWMPLLFVHFAMASMVLGAIFAEVGWDKPFRWLTIIMLFALIADHYVNR